MNKHVYNCKKLVQSCIDNYIYVVVNIIMLIAFTIPTNLINDRNLNHWKSKHVNTPELEKIIRHAKASLRFAAGTCDALRGRTCCRTALPVDRRRPSHLNAP